VSMKNIYKIYSIILLSFCNIAFVWAITLTVPPTDGNQDIVLTGPTQIESQSDLITWYIQLVNQYLRFAMIVLLFVLLVWIWFKLMTNEAGSDNAKKVLKDWILSAWAGIILIMLSYTIVRLVINLL
jgi:hypothetical protein